MKMEGAVGIAVGLTGILSFVITKLWDAYHMQKRYRTIEDAKRDWEGQRDKEERAWAEHGNKEETCMKERKAAEGDIRGQRRIAGRSPCMGGYEGRSVGLPPSLPKPLWRHWSP